MRIFRTIVMSAALLSLLGFSACGGTSQEEIDKAKQEGARQQKLKDQQTTQSRKQRELERKLRALEKRSNRKSSSSSGSNSSSNNSSSGNASSGSTGCGGGLSVNSATSCSFAENVRAEWLAAGSGSVSIDVYSPVTGTTYRMYCSAGATTVCTGGRNAAVYIR